MISIECRTCPVRELHCDDCMVPVLLQISTSRTEGSLDADERAAVTRLVGAGLVDAETASRARARLDPPSEERYRLPGRAVG
ncbi:hypothetical protein KC207_07580 [Phycicoccus sp. BSK3Z-2]|uniref:Uncharacterized protein n=1 Tax=Phycicoccus avicenniae TaxID=2828860 RepID=A0A941I0I3_9MICO|nr:hypothetical protein [Phycicoccus avicenniae]